MSVNLNIGKQNSYSSAADQPDYGRLGPSANQQESRLLSSDEVSSVLSFLGPQDLLHSEKVCRLWKQIIISSRQWERQWQYKLGISNITDLRKFLPEEPSYRKIFQLIFPSILDRSVYQHYIGEIGPVPQIPEAISPKRWWGKRDPCDPDKMIAAEYDLMYCPPYIKITVPGDSYLDKPDDPADSEAPKLILKEAGLMKELAETIGFGAKSKTKVLKVPVTINNIAVIFNRPKTGNPSTYSFVWDSIIEQHGNKRISAGWTCMRKSVIGKKLSFAQQQEVAKKMRVVPTDLLRRILFNFLEHVRSKKANAYPDNKNPYVFARTSTLTLGPNGIDQPSGCGSGDSSGLRVSASTFDQDSIGLAVELPMEVQTGTDTV